jgi:hypothetical protein
MLVDLLMVTEYGTLGEVLHPLTMIVLSPYSFINSIKIYPGFWGFGVNALIELNNIIVKRSFQCVVQVEFERISISENLDHGVTTVILIKSEVL